MISERLSAKKSMRIGGDVVGQRSRWLTPASILLYVALTLISVFMLAPLIYMVCCAFKTSSDMFNYTLLPYEPSEKLIAVAGPLKDQKFVIQGDQFTIGPPQNATVRVDFPAGTEAGATPLKFVRNESGQWDLEGICPPCAMIAGKTGGKATLKAGEIVQIGTSKFMYDAGHVPTVRNFYDLFTKFHFGRHLLNSFFLTSTATSISLILCSLGGFALVKYQFKGKKIMLGIMLATMMIPSSVLLAPNYELLAHMGLMNTFTGLLLPGIVGAFGMLLFRQAMLAVPDDLIEAARIDGCSEFGIYWKIIMPVVRPMSGAFCLMAFMANWNSFLMPMIVLQSEQLFTVPIVLSQTIGLTGDNQYGPMMAGTFIGVLPPAILFFLLQKEFIAGLTTGAVKG
ncbi:MAG TPA: carbohydrate ABC transporter permease [Planctomycetota bacterium]|jgi:ABC-type glycerol-3-phosphate transport system permease component